MTIKVLLPCLLLVASCHSSAGGSGPDAADTGAADGPADAVRDASAMFSDSMFKILDAKGLEFDGPSTSVLLTSYAEACTHATAGAGVSGARTLLFGVADIGADRKSVAVTAPGTYSIFSGTIVPASSHAAEAYIGDLDTACLRADQVRATSGSVKITTVTASRLEGTYALTFPGLGQVSGLFAAPACDAFNPNSSVVTTCGPP